MKRVLLLPLDERPCNYDYTALMAGGTDIEVVRPPRELLGIKKTPGDVEAIWKWLKETAPTCDGAIISIDTLVYSGIVPSRIHHYEEHEINERINRLTKLKKENPNLTLFAFSLIMRCPQYSSGDEEPDYYEICGREIFRTGYIKHKIELGIATDEERAELEHIGTVMPKEHFDDYVSRRKKNIEINKRAIELTKEGVIDFLIIPQDDSSPYGLTAKDQQVIRDHIKSNEQQFRVYMYPDADAVENTLLARLVNKFKGVRPMVYLKYASALGDTVIPSFEDRTVNETIKYQVLAAGGLIASSVAEADIILMINTPSGNVTDHATTYDLPHMIEYDANRNQIEQVEFAEYAINVLKKAVCFADIAYANGGDPELFDMLRIKGMLYRVAGYAGWNTSSNTLGTCIPQSMIYFIYGERKEHLDFLALRYLEDVGYMAFVRKDMCSNHIEKMGCDYFHTDGKYGEIAKLVQKKLSEFAEKNLKTDEYKVNILDCCMPWSRMFEVGLKVKLEPNTKKRIFVSEE